MSDYAGLAQFLATAVVPDVPVDVRTEYSERQTVIRLVVPSEIAPRLIGRGGHIIRSIRDIVRAAGLRHHERVTVEVSEAEVSENQ